ncbi:MAG: winged helix-turn-helix transcriptional regulator, partial [Candidatus Methanomethylophilaceae archaeon]|nr:winged helix-turn-helix transcriptional regulator [Candidatus Methanomethylophilaceae archaeon]
DGMVRRDATSEGGTRVTYFITDKGASIGPILAQLAAWGMENQMVSVIVPDEEEKA